MNANATFGQPRPAWFRGCAETLAVLKGAAAGCGVTLHQDTAPTVDQAQALEEELADTLIARGFEGDWEITPFGSLVENLIDALHRYAYPDGH
ncbi:hypothetical protein P3T37_007325 [Kitasatospora sp. MAA4]|uniref:hypothetical protein n=1 Tax=Kitasatospora sp. MAA4 TaxID=3035093 RepID=UPI00247598AB|nr:hypothetical protein [Kitasatospora sp. MAA4]MDH6137887.1 hypothetical protein [Kitasatospora sp. MAA4]